MIGTCWALNTWSNDSWGLHTWANASIVQPIVRVWTLAARALDWTLQGNRTSWNVDGDYR